MNNRLIRVQGRGKASQAPDRIIVNFDIAQIQKEFGEAVSGCNSRVEGIRNSLSALGLDPKSLKTTSLEVDHAHDYLNDKKVLIGFEASHHTKIELDWDKSLVATVMNSIDGTREVGPHES